MSDDRKLTVSTKKHVAAINRMFGIAAALGALEEQKSVDRMPGFGLAKTIVERELADIKASVLHMNLVEVSNAGIDIATVKDVTLSSSYVNPTILVTFQDLLSEVED